VFGVCGVKEGIPVGSTPCVAEVGKGGGVSVGKVVGSGVSVGGTEVAVGTAAWVCATTVNAPASAVC